MAISNIVALDASDRSPVASPAEAALRTVVADSMVHLALFDLHLRPLMFSRGWLAETATSGVAAPGGRVDGPFGEAAARCLVSGQVETCTVEIPHDGKAARWFEFEFSPWPSDAPPNRVVALGRETTRTVQAIRAAEEAQRRLAEQNARFDAALGRRPVGTRLR